MDAIINKFIKTTLTTSAFIIGVSCVTFSLPLTSMAASQSFVAETITPQEVSDSSGQNLKLDDCWEYNEKTKTLRIKNDLSQFGDEIFQTTDTWDRFEGRSPWDSYSKEIEKITVDEGIKLLPVAIFSGLPNLKDAKLPSTLTNMPDYMFFDCSSLEKIEIPDSVTSIGYESFYNCSSLKEVKIGKGVNAIGRNAFGYCNSLKNIVVSEDNLDFSVQDGILYDKQMKTIVLVMSKTVDSVKIPETVETIAPLAFANCKNLKQIHIPYKVKEISDGAFYNCTNLKSITFAKNSKCQKITDFVANYGDLDDDYFEDHGTGKEVKSLEIYGAFENCKSLTAISFPDSLKTIGYYTLTNCTSLKSIHFGSKFERAFHEIAYSEPLSFIYYRGLSNLTTITVSAKNKAYSSNSGILFNKSKTKLVWYPQNRKAKTYKLPAKVKEIGVRAFQDNRNLTKLNLSSVQTIYDQAFYNCKKLKTVQWSKKLKKIGYLGFASCKKLTAFTSFGNSLRIEQEAFSNCKALKSITLKYGTRYIGEGAFHNCAAKKVTIPSSVKSIGDRAFGYYETEEKAGKIKNFTIYCKKSSTAYSYAKKNKLKYKFY